MYTLDAGHLPRREAAIQRRLFPIDLFGGRKSGRVQIMELVLQLLKLASAASLGLLIGALLAEGAIFVPYWRTLPPPVFFALRKEWGPRLYRFFAPLTIAASFAAIGAAVACWFVERPYSWPTLVCGMLAAALVLIYAAYFKSANARLASAQLNGVELAAELRRWTQWHWARVAIGMLAFAASLLGLQAPR